MFIMNIPVCLQSLVDPLFQGLPAILYPQPAGFWVFLQVGFLYPKFYAMHYNSIE